MSDQPQLHRVVWNAEKIANFWDLQSQIGSQNYYSHQLGTALVRYVRRRVPLRPGRVLDFGCGPGFLLEKLGPWTDQLVGCDVSPASIQAAATRAIAAELSHQPSVPTDLKPASFRVIWLVETIEHLLPEQRHAILSELRRLITADGWLIVTTPNREPLEASEVVCPDCGCAFHRYQHVSRWDSGSLATEIDAHGFRVAACQAVHLTEEGWYSRFRGWLTSRLRGYRPNLIYIGRAAAAVLLWLLVGWVGAAQDLSAEAATAPELAVGQPAETIGTRRTDPRALPPQLAEELEAIAWRMRTLAELMAQPEPDTDRIERLQRTVLAELAELLGESSSGDRGSIDNDSAAGEEGPGGTQRVVDADQDQAATASAGDPLVDSSSDPAGNARPRETGLPEQQDAAAAPGPGSGNAVDGELTDPTGDRAGPDIDAGSDPRPASTGVEITDRTATVDAASANSGDGSSAEGLRPNMQPTLLPELTTHERVWGHLPERLRLQIESRPVPSPLPAYRRSVERYFERLAELEP